uniref:Nucleocapsid protein n=1 Tax=Siphonapteran orthomyxo-related virus OKIAV157 TaxID=2746283 RepID=A0A7D7F879_9ORTO|nr:nucleocapsid protein [Siphonapteran orthomyxo-related virus OKIAV157]
MSNNGASNNADSRKRKLFDPDSNKEITDVKKARYELKPTVKAQVITFIIRAFIALHFKIMGDFDRLTNITVGGQIMNILHTGHSVLRQSAQRENKAVLESKVRTGTPKVSYLGTEYPIAIEDLKGVVSGIAKLCGLAYSATSAPAAQPDEDVNMAVDDAAAAPAAAPAQVTLLGGDEWFGIAGPIFNFLTGFNLRWRELRLGHDEIPFKKEDGNVHSYPISTFGLKRSHGLLLEGCRFPPERRSSMIQSLGPMTLLVSYLLAKPGYEDKLKTALTNSIPILRDFPNILETMKGKKFGDLKNIIGLIAEISILTTTRQRNRAFPPPAVFVSILSNAGDYNAVKGFFALQSVSGPTITDSGNKRKILRSNITFSGIAQAVLNNVAAENSWTIAGEFSDAEFQQLIFHCWWGTYKEDFGILKSITNHANWFKRDQYGKKFRAPSTQKANTIKGLVSMKYFSKLSNAIQTNYAGTGLRQVASIPCFSGNRVRVFGGSYFKYVAEQTYTAGNASTLQGIENELTIVFKKMLDRLRREEGTMDSGTTSWFQVDQNNSEAILMDASKMVPVFPADIKENGSYFLG